MPFADVLSQVSTGTIDASGTDWEKRLHNYLVESYEDFKKKCLDDAKRGKKSAQSTFYNGYKEELAEYKYFSDKKELFYAASFLKEHLKSDGFIKVKIEYEKPHWYSQLYTSITVKVAWK